MSLVNRLTMTWENSQLNFAKLFLVFCLVTGQIRNLILKNYVSSSAPSLGKFTTYFCKIMLGSPSCHIFTAKEIQAPAIVSWMKLIKIIGSVSETGEHTLLPHDWRKSANDV